MDVIVPPDPNKHREGHEDHLLWIPSGPTPSPAIDNGPTAPPSVPTACSECRRLKMRCIRSPDDAFAACARCSKGNKECIIPIRKTAGRKRGSTSRDVAEDSTAKPVKRVRIATSTSELNTGDTQTLPEAFARQPVRSSNAPIEPFPSRAHYTFSPVALPFDTPQSSYHVQNQVRENISNPMGLLADVSASVPMRPPEAIGIVSPRVSADAVLEAETILNMAGEPPAQFRLTIPRDTLVRGLEPLLKPGRSPDKPSTYFADPLNVVKTDTGPEHDPVDLGLVSIPEIEELFPIYFCELNPISGILDPELHTAQYCKSKSCLLFVWVLALAAQTHPQHANLAHRLRLHGQKLAQFVVTHGCKSVEVAQGLYLSLVFEAPASSLVEEKTWLYTAAAVALAIELGLNNISSVLPAKHSSDGLIGSRNSREARNRERTWLRIMLWDRAYAAVSGRVNPFPHSDLTATIESWWTHPLALDCDRQVSALVTLRRLLASLYTQLKAQLSNCNGKTDWVREWIDSAMDTWCLTWLGSQSPRSPMSPVDTAKLQLHYVYRHGRLLTMSLALHGQFLGNGQNEVIKRDCMDAALRCCESAVILLDSSQSSKTHIVIFAMIAYSAVFLLELLPFVTTSLSVHAPVLGLLGHIGSQLVRVGTEKNVQSKAIKYGEQLLLILGKKAQELAFNVQECRNARQREATEPAFQGAESALDDNPFTWDWGEFDYFGCDGISKAPSVDLNFDFGDSSTFASMLFDPQTSIAQISER